MLSYPRIAFAMAQDGVLPSVFARLGTRSRAPLAAVALLGALISLTVLLGTYEQILSYVVVMDWLFFDLSRQLPFRFSRARRTTRRRRTASRIPCSRTSLDHRRFCRSRLVGRPQHHLQISSQCGRRSVYPFRRGPRLFPVPRPRTACRAVLSKKTGVTGLVHPDKDCTHSNCPQAGESHRHQSTEADREMMDRYITRWLTARHAAEEYIAGRQKDIAE